MKKTIKIAIGLTVLTGIGILVVHELKRRRQSRKVADNGYETAHDVLYPGKKGKDKKLHFGPVLPR
ncbi:MAG: hypothetical protein ACHQFX_10180 [Chitinophagales bacterium]